MTTTTAPEVLETTFRVGPFRVRMCADLAALRRGAVHVLEAEWDPIPWRPLSPRELRDYRRGRDAFLLELARHVRGNVVIAELGP